MKKIILSLFILGFLLNSCDKIQTAEEKIIGEWEIESIEDPGCFFGTDDITDNFQYSNLVFCDNGIIELNNEKDSRIISGEWEKTLDSYMIMQPDGDGGSFPMTYYTNVIEIEWNQTTDFPKELEMGKLSKKELKLYSKNKDKLVFTLKKKGF